MHTGCMRFSHCNYRYNNFTNNRYFSAPTSQPSNPNVNAPAKSGLPQNIQNLIDRDQQRNPNANRTRIPSATNKTTNTKKETVYDPSSMLSKERQEQIEKAFNYCVEQVKLYNLF